LAGGKGTGRRHSRIVSETKWLKGKGVHQAKKAGSIPGERKTECHETQRCQTTNSPRAVDWGNYKKKKRNNQIIRKKEKKTVSPSGVKKKVEKGKGERKHPKDAWDLATL